MRARMSRLGWAYYINREDGGRLKHRYFLLATTLSGCWEQVSRVDYVEFRQREHAKWKRTMKEGKDE
jgi:hypothetical protein